MEGVRILVVDDNPTNLKLATSVLASAGYEVDQAEDAERAQAIIRQTPPGLILMDLDLPGMDGLTLTRKLKADPQTKHIRIIALTAFAMKGDDQRVREAGCDGYITKPIDTRALPGQVEQTLKPAQIPGGGITNTAGPRRKLLIVEDDPQTMKLLSDFLLNAGYEVHQAHYSLQGLFAVARVEPDLILADLNMPVVDGLTMIRQLKGHDETKSIPVVVVSADDTHESREAAFAAGCQGYIAKPIDTRRFLDQIAQFLPKSGRKKS